MKRQMKLYPNLKWLLADMFFIGYWSKSLQTNFNWFHVLFIILNMFFVWFYLTQCDESES